eukprot:7873002-Pyramimonas_sp.AAC.1
MPRKLAWAFAWYTLRPPRYRIAAWRATGGVVSPDVWGRERGRKVRADAQQVVQADATIRNGSRARWHSDLTRRLTRAASAARH